MEGTLQKAVSIRLFKPKTKPDMVREDMINRLTETKKRLDAIRSAFEAETDFDLIDAYIYEIDGIEKQYSYLIKQAKNLL